MNSFVLAQLHAVGSGAAHHAPAWAPWQRALMAASSSAYLANAVCWSRYDHPILAGVFIAVAILSTAADALSDAVFAPAALARVRTADRAVGSTALVASVVANSLSPVMLTYSAKMVNIRPDCASSSERYDVIPLSRT